MCSALAEGSWLVVGDGDTETSEAVEVVRGDRTANRERLVAERCEIEQAGIAPPTGIDCLLAEAFELTFVTKAIDVRAHLLPNANEVLSLMNTTIIVPTETLPEVPGTTVGITPIWTSECPRKMMKPEKILLGTRLRVVVQRTQ